MKKFTSIELRNWSEKYSGDLNSIDYGYHLSVGVLLHFLGPAWVEQNVKVANLYLKTNHTSEEELNYHCARVVDLAELLFNLQDITGVNERVEALITDAKKLEDIVAELTSAKLLVASGIVPVFVTPKGQKGSDYDIEFSLRTGEKICCEVKCKLESTELSVKTIENALEKARKQLPKSEVGFIFVKVPETWSKRDICLSVMSDSVDSIFRQTQRIASVIFYADEIVLLPENVMGRVIVSKEFVNEKSYDSKAYSKLLKEVREIGVVPNWVQLHYFR